jgi:hypothetical protein
VKNLRLCDAWPNWKQRPQAKPHLSQLQQQVRKHRLPPLYLPQLLWLRQQQWHLLRLPE